MIELTDLVDISKFRSYLRYVMAILGQGNGSGDETDLSLVFLILH
jgi:hypothetical protein